MKRLPAFWSAMDKRLLGFLAKGAMTLVALGVADVLVGSPTHIALVWIFAVLWGLRSLVSVLLWGEYQLSWTRASSRTGVIQLMSGAIVFLVSYPVLNFVFDVPAQFLALEWLCYQYFYNMALFGYRYLYKNRYKGKGTVAIYGAGPGGVRLARELREEGYKIMGFVDDAEHNQRMRIDGLRVYSIEGVAEAIVRTQTWGLLVFAFQNYDQKEIDARWGLLKKGFRSFRILPPAEDLLKDRSYLSQLKDVSIEDLLARRPKDLDARRISQFLSGKKVLITGAGGSIGSELARQCAKFGVSELIALDHSEYALYALVESIGAPIIPVMASVTEFSDMERVFRTYKPDVVLHAAAYKHVPMVELNPEVAIQNNVVGTKNCVDLAIRHGVKKFVLISTDKAVRPTNVMGCTKRICELYAQNSNGRGTDIVAVRFGNVLGSSGSVIPRFRRLIAENKNLTVTHPEITRYFMLIPEACGLVLQAGAMGTGGEIFILDMGEPVLIADLAHRMLELSGRTDLSVEYTGLRPGEKLYEELLISDSDVATEYKSITVAKPTPYPFERLWFDIQHLLDSDDKIDALKRIVPEFSHRRDN